MEWVVDNELDFSVSSFYSYYMRWVTPYGHPNKCDVAFGLLWKTEVPFKIKTFGWILFHNRVPTKDLLLHRGISLPLDNLYCSFSGVDLETCRHIFFYRGVVKRIWNEITSWVSIGDRKEEECLSSFIEWHSFFRSYKVKNVNWVRCGWPRRGLFGY